MSTQSLRSEISVFRNLIAKNSVSPDSLGYILDSMLTLMESSDGALDAYKSEVMQMLQQIAPMSKHTYCDAGGYILTNKLNPYDVLIRQRLQEQVPNLVYTSDLTAAVDGLTSAVLLFNAATAGHTSARFPEISLPGSAGALHLNGHFPAESTAAPFMINGLRLTAAEMLRVIFDRYTPYTGGVQCNAKTNLVRIKTTDSSLSLDYACVNNGDPVVIALGASWADSVRPASMKRAFDNCSALQAVIGEIDMSVIPSAWAANSLFASCPQLWQFHLANIPDAIETLDLSGVSAHITDNFSYINSAGSQVSSSSLKYLATYFRRDITRTKQLTVKLPAAVFNQVADDPFYAVGGITWASA